MNTFRIIPCLDIRAGRVVKGTRFQDIKDCGDPIEFAMQFQDDGADELVVLDISATLEERSASTSLIRALRSELSIPLTVGGGVRSVADAMALVAAGADRVAVNSAAVFDPDLITQLSEKLGRQAVVVSIDAKRGSAGYELRIRSGSQPVSICPMAWAELAERKGAGEILLTSWDQDGTGTGYDLELLGQLSLRLKIPIIASGGASTLEHFDGALAAGASAVLAASLFQTGGMTIGALKRDLSLLGWRIRKDDVL